MKPAMLETVQSLSLLTLAEIIGPILLAAGLVWGIMHSRRRNRAADDSFARAQASRETDPPPVRQEERTRRRTLFAVGAVVAIIVIAVATLGPQIASKSFHEGTVGSPGNPERPGSEPIKK
jgi:hypothetical protein